MKNPRTVIYHKGCWDGLAAAWGVRRSWPDAVFVPATYGDESPSVTGHDVMIVDFSYSRPVIDAMRDEAESLTLLDHHQSALPLASIPGCIVDQDHSGAGLAWDFMYPSMTAPKLLRYIEDRDLWRFEMDRSKEVSAGLSSYPQTFETLDRFMFDNFGLDDLLRDGTAILRYQQQKVERICEHVQWGCLGGYNIPMVNSSTLQSEIGAEIARGVYFVAVWYAASDGTVRVSLRSDDQGADVAKIAESFGGGGHTHAAGFTVPLAEWPFRSGLVYR